MCYNIFTKRHKTRLEARSVRMLLALLLVEMRGSRTPCPNEPTGEYATGLVDAFSYTSVSHRQDPFVLALWS